jgi:Leucine-rich repeat (LRR) protein
LDLNEHNRSRAKQAMCNGRAAVPIARVICTFIALVCWCINTTRAAEEKGDSVLDLLKRYQTEKPKVQNFQAGGRTLHFPADRLLGTLNIQDVNTPRYIDTFFYWTTQEDTEWKYLAQAKGDVAIPPGKRLALSVNQSGWKDLSPLSNIGPNDLYSLSIYGPYEGGPLPDDKCMPHIAHLTGLKVLYLANTAISAEGLKFIKGLKSLERLSISKQLTDDGLAEIAQLPSLNALYINESRLTDAGLVHLAELKSLEELDIGNGRMSNAGLAHLAKLGSLRYLMLAGKNFTDDGLIYIKDIPSIKILHFGALSHLTDKALVHLANVTTLERLSLHWVEKITDSGIANLKKLPSLKKLDIGHSQVTDSGLAHLKEIKSLDYLDLPYSRISDNGLAYLKELSNLKHLNVGASTASPITNAGLAHLKRLKLLEELHIAGQGITDEGMVHIAELTNLKDLLLMTGPLNQGRLTGAGLSNLTRLKSLEKLYLSQTNMTLADLKQLGKLPNLTNLNVTQIRHGNTFLDISGLTKLKHLSINLKRPDIFSDEDLACLARLKGIEWLQIGPREFSDLGIGYLRNLTEMERLGIGGPDLTDEGLVYFGNMGKLNHLTINDGQITDAGLRNLEGLKAIGYLNIGSRQRFSPAALQHLRQQLPNLTTLRTEVKTDSSNTAGNPKVKRP